MKNKIKKIKLIQKYLSLNSAVKMSFWFLVSSFLQKGIHMLMTPIFTRIMTEANYGKYSVYSSWDSFALVLFTLNIAGGFYVRELVITDRDKNSFTSSLVGLTTVLCSSGLCLYLILQTEINKLTGLSTFLTVLIFFQIYLASVHSFWMSEKRVKYEYKKIVLLTLLTSILIPIISVLLVKNCPEKYQVEARAFSNFLIYLTFYLGLLISIFKKGKKFFILQCWKDALIFSIPLIPHYLSKVVLSQADKVMISAYCGMAEAGYYSVAHAIAFAAQIFNSAVAASLDPWIYKCIKRGDLKKLNYVATRILMVIGLLNFILVAIGPEIIKIMAPSSYYSAIWIIPPATASVFFMFMYDLFASFQYYFGKTKWVMYASILGAILNIVLNRIFIPIFGFVAAGYTTLICYVTFGIAHYIFMCKVCDNYLNYARPYKLSKIILIGVALLTGICVLTIFYNYSIIRYLILFVLVIVAAIKRKKIFELFSEIREKN